MSTAIAFVGAGGVTSWQHFPNIEPMTDVEVVAICDINEAAASKAAERFNAVDYTDHQTLYEEHDLDAVFVAVPPFAHGSPERAAAGHGINIFVEKPLGLDTETAHAVHEAVDNAGLVTQVGYMNRYADVVERTKTLIGDRTVSLVTGRWIGGVPGTAWWGVGERSGGQIVEQATHIYDLARYFAGEVETVAAYGGQEVVTEAIDFEDTTTASMKHTNGAVSQIASSSAAPDDDVGLRIVGDGFRLNVNLIDRVLTGIVDGEAISYDGEEIDEAFRAEVADYLTAVQDEDPEQPRSPYSDAQRSFALTLAVNESLATDGPVSIGDQ